MQCIYSDGDNTTEGEAKNQEYKSWEAQEL